MDESSFTKNFPHNKSIPDLLWKLYIFQEKNNGLYSGHFSLYDRFWETPFSDILRPYFAFFGLDADGSMYGFWLHSDFPLETCPVVFLGFEGVGNTVLANSFKEFLSLLSLAVDELGYRIQEADWEDHILLTESSLNFREWLRFEFDIQPPQNPLAMVNMARKLHPDLEVWLKEMTGKSQKPRIEKWDSG